MDDDDGVTSNRKVAKVNDLSALLKVGIGIFISLSRRPLEYVLRVLSTTLPSIEVELVSPISLLLWLMLIDWPGTIPDTFDET